jgi:inosine-uridine nucleoside N-ribohydrolase
MKWIGLSRASGAGKMAPTKVILDVDTGTDDAVALMLAVLHPGLELVAATCVGGNTPVDNVVENTLRVMDWIGATVPVFVGCGQAIARSVPPAEGDPGQTDSIHGEHLDLPAATSKAQPGVHAVDWLLNYYADDRGADTVLVATGPLTNLAMAIKMRPELAGQIPRIVIMGGGHAVCNCTPSAEFNFWQDPEAAKVVVNSGAAITLVPLDATHTGGVVTLDDCEQLRALGTPAGEAAAIFAERRARACE